ncbi:HNH endonuclease family protein [Succiniclasticum ruminis]|uniref:HNH nuclease domain-containing protein n=1 Tax=Succiniclasticum ruminis DSM 9236 TaxID=1123323 RepID=A0A1I2E7K2_9FIRM|nr:DUF262 domain-containing protein [Succiniclasticum ruminis]SFE88240.1 Protein of unknown function DUF262 [Succiniclasticum ruminis DSM 9236]
MKIEMYEIPISEVVAGYLDSADNGVVAYHGRLDVRPPFQREFIYKDNQRDEVIRTIRKGFPLNVMYWSVSGKNDEGEDTYELMDGQQRTISIGQYVAGDFSIDHRGFGNLTTDEQQQILDYKLNIYICDGTEKEKLDWFKIINIVGEELTPQELRNAIYTGSWLADAKKKFSKPSGVGIKIGEPYVKGEPKRQDFLETALSWIADKENITIEDYMADNQHEANAEELLNYFRTVIKWIETVFPTPKGKKPRKEMKGLKWGILYNKYADKFKVSLEDKVDALMADDEVGKKSGIYEYLLSGDEKYLSLREFRDNEKRTAYEKQKGICAICGEPFDFDQMQGDHIKPWSLGGKTVLENCQMLCQKCNLEKKAKYSKPKK